MAKHRGLFVRIALVDSMAPARESKELKAES